MLLLIRTRYPRVANVLSFLTGVATLTIGVACGASATVLILGGGSSVALSLARHLGKRDRRSAGGGGTAALR
jgi:hypothetical protein